MARGYKSQSKGGTGAGLVGDDGDNGDEEAMTIVMAIGLSDDDYGDGNCLHPPLARPLVGWWVVFGYSRGLALVLVMMGIMVMKRQWQSKWP